MPANSSYHTIKSMMPFILALEKAEIAFRSFRNHDLHYNPELIEDLDIVILMGHDEYWSHSIRESLEEFVKQGGNIASFAGNTGWWAIDVDGDDIYVDKSFTPDDICIWLRPTSPFRRVDECLAALGKFISSSFLIVIL